MTTRRGFLSLLGLGAGAMTLDPERLLWVSGKKLISIPTASYTPTMAEINSYANKYITPRLVDEIFKKDPLFVLLFNDWPLIDQRGLVNV